MFITIPNQKNDLNCLLVRNYTLGKGPKVLFGDKAAA